MWGKGITVYNSTVFRGNNNNLGGVVCKHLSTNIILAKFTNNTTGVPTAITDAEYWSRGMRKWEYILDEVPTGRKRRSQGTVAEFQPAWELVFHVKNRDIVTTCIVKF